MADASENTVADSVTLRMSWRRALMLGGAFNFGIFVITALPRVVVRGDFSALLHAIGFFSVLMLLYSWPMRELLKVWMSPEGIGSRRNPTPWNEIHEVERGKFFGSAWSLYSTYQPDVMVIGSVANTPEFREALDRFAPPEHLVRQIIGEAPK
jgi:hypothetical protein